MEKEENVTKKEYNIPWPMPVRMIWVTFRKAGVHCYPEAAINPDLADVSYLAYPHRHIFHFRVSIEVFHDNRDIEFIQFKNWLESLYDGGTLQLDNKSCEMIGQELFLKIQEKYDIHTFNYRQVAIEVSEDGENGCKLYY